MCISNFDRCFWSISTNNNYHYYYYHYYDYATPDTSIRSSFFESDIDQPISESRPNLALSDHWSESSDKERGFKGQAYKLEDQNQLSSLIFIIQHVVNINCSERFSEKCFNFVVQFLFDCVYNTVST